MQFSYHRPRIRFIPSVRSTRSTTKRKITSLENDDGHVRKKRNLGHYRTLPIHPLQIPQECCQDFTSEYRVLSNVPTYQQRHISFPQRFKEFWVRTGSPYAKLHDHLRDRQRVRLLSDSLIEDKPPEPVKESPWVFDPLRNKYIDRSLFDKRNQEPSALTPSGLVGPCFYDRLGGEYIHGSPSDSCKEKPLRPQPVQGFPMFQKLPPEIRMQVFEFFALERGPNNVYISCHKRSVRRDPVFEGPVHDWTHEQARIPGPGRKIPENWQYVLRARYNIHPLLHTNYEARVVARKFYTASFGYQLSHSRGVWFDHTRDTLIMESGGAFDLFKNGIWNKDEDRSEQKKVEKALRYLGIHGLTDDEIVAMCDYPDIFQNLKELYVERVPILGLEESYEEYFYMIMRRELRETWEAGKRRGEIEAVPEVHTLPSKDFRDTLGYKNANFTWAASERTISTRRIRKNRMEVKLSWFDYLYKYDYLNKDSALYARDEAVYEQDMDWEGEAPVCKYQNI